MVSAEREPLACVGRGAELASLDGALSRLRAGEGWLWVVEGEPGIGKTRLLDEARTRAEGLGFAVLRAGGHELGQELSFGAVAEALDLRSGSLDRDRAQLAALLRSAPPRGHVIEYRLLDDILSLLERLTMDRPALLTMDDLQWVDSSSLLSLAHLGRRLPVLPLGMMTAVRPPPRRGPVEQFLRSPGDRAERLRLAGLDEDAVAALLAELVGGSPGTRLRDLIRGAAGNPLLIRELVAALRREGALASGDGTVELTTRRLPASFNELVVRRLDELPAPAADLLRVASVLGTVFSMTDLVELAGRPAGVVAGELEPALRAGLLEGSKGRLAFRHQLVRDGVYGRLTNGVRVALHRQAGHLLAARGAGPAEVAAHLSLAAEEGAAEAVEWLARAARDISRRSPRTAVELWDRALELTGAGHPGREEMLADRALALSWAGRADVALKAAQEMLAASLGAPVEGRLRLGLAQALLVQGRWRQAATELEVLARRARPGSLEAAHLLGDAALANAHSGSLEQASEQAATALRIGRRLKDGLAQSVAQSSLSVVAYLQARFQDSLEAARQAVALAGRTGSPEAALRPAPLWFGLGLIDTDRFQEAVSVLQAGRRRAEEAGMHWQLPLYDDGIGTLHFQAGEWDDAAAEMETCIALAQETGTLWWLVPANCVLAYIAIHRDHDKLAGRLLEVAHQHSAPGSFGHNRLLWVSGLLREADGDPEGALAILEAAWQATLEAGFAPHRLMIGPDLVRLAVRAGAGGRAAEVAGAVAETAGRTGVESAVAIGLRCRGLAGADRTLLAGAVARLEGCPRPVELAFAREDLAVRLAAEGRPAEAAPLFEAALEQYRRIGARRDVYRVVSELRACGVRRPGGERPRRPAAGWSALTPTERRVVDLASQGLTNPEIAGRLFISRRTVATHLEHVFGKLGISSRVQLAATARERGSGG